MPDLLFSPGTVTATTPAASLMLRLGVDYVELLDRHVQGDYGDVEPDSVEANRETLEEGVGTVLSIYRVKDETLWVATTIPQDGSRYTTIMLPSDW